MIKRLILTGLAALQALTITASAADMHAAAVAVGLTPREAAYLIGEMRQHYRIEAGLLERIEDGIATVEIMRNGGELEYYDYYYNNYAEINPGDAVTVVIYDNNIIAVNAG